MITYVRMFKSNDSICNCAFNLLVEIGREIAIYSQEQGRACPCRGMTGRLLFVETKPKQGIEMAMRPLNVSCVFISSWPAVWTKSCYLVVFCEERVGDEGVRFRFWMPGTQSKEPPNTLQNFEKAVHKAHLGDHLLHCDESSRRYQGPHEIEQKIARWFVFIPVYFMTNRWSLISIMVLAGLMWLPCGSASPLPWAWRSRSVRETPWSPNRNYKRWHSSWQSHPERTSRIKSEVKYVAFSYRKKSLPARRKDLRFVKHAYFLSMRYIIARCINN